MHFLREGQFEVASAFFGESVYGDERHAPRVKIEPHSQIKESEQIQAGMLQRQFANMYYILNEMKSNMNLLPATHWARAHSAALEARGSNLEFELGKLQFVRLFFTGQATFSGSVLRERQQAALTYARTEFGTFQDRYLREIQQLIGAMAFGPNLAQSPYKRAFNTAGAWESIAISFTREFCSLLGLSADSPIYIAATAGAIALPTLQKLRVIMEKKRTEWTSQNELPVC